MKLSEAIRLGAMLKPQCREHLSYHGATCALGAAADAIGCLDVHKYHHGWNAFYATWPILQTPVDPPASLGKFKCQCELSTWVIYLNDKERWTREQIADWVESIEREQQEPTTERTPARRAGDPADASAALPVVRA